MNKKMTYLAFGAAFIGMGIAMPQCPGEKAMQDQVDHLQASNMALNQKINMLETQVKGLNDQSNQFKVFATQITSAVTAQTNALERVDAAIKELQTKATAKTSSKGKAKKKR